MGSIQVYRIRSTYSYTETDLSALLLLFPQIQQCLPAHAHLTACIGQDT